MVIDFFVGWTIGHEGIGVKSWGLGNSRSEKSRLFLKWPMKLVDESWVRMKEMGLRGGAGERIGFAHESSV